MRVDHVGTAVEIEQPPHAREHGRHDRRQRGRHGDGEREPVRHVRDGHPARHAAGTARRRQVDGAQIALRVDPFDTVDLPLREKAHQLLPRERRAVRQRKCHVAAGRRARRSAFAQAQRVQPIALQEQIVEAAHAAEPGRRRDDGHGQRGVGQQSLRHQEPLRLREFDRRYAELRGEDPAQMALGHADALRECVDGAAAVQETVVDQRRGRIGEIARHVEQAVARRELGAATHARPEAGLLGGRGGREVAAVLRFRRLHGTNGAAIHAGRAHADEEPAVEAAVSRQQGVVADVGIEAHATTVNHPPRRFWLKSGMCIGPPGTPRAPRKTAGKTVNATLRNSRLFSAPAN
ncbi:hypothetical protein FEP47_02068 [Burkholderia multivorans]|nr:hypothetical protein [Burkholderia multivorans]